MIALLSTAIAATVTVCFTAEIDLDDVDLGTEDYFTANTDRELRGIEFQYGVVGGGFSAAAFADNNGCATSSPARLSACSSYCSRASAAARACVYYQTGIWRPPDLPIFPTSSHDCSR